MNIFLLFAIVKIDVNFTKEDYVSSKLVVQFLRKRVSGNRRITEHAEMWEFLNKARVFIKMIELWVKIGSIEI